MWSISLAMADCPLSGRGQGHVNNFNILDLEKISPEQVVINKLVDGQLVDYTYDGRPRRAWMRNFVIRCKSLTPLVRFVLDLSYKLFLHQLARFWLTYRVARSVCNILAVHSCIRCVCKTRCWHSELSRIQHFVFSSVFMPRVNNQNVKSTFQFIKLNIISSMLRNCNIWRGMWQQLDMGSWQIIFLCKRLENV